MFPHSALPLRYNIGCSSADFYSGNNFRPQLELNIEQVHKHYHTLKFQSRPATGIQEKPIIEDTDAVQRTSTSEILLLTGRQ